MTCLIASMIDEKRFINLENEHKACQHWQKNKRTSQNQKKKTRPLLFRSFLQRVAFLSYLGGIKINENETMERNRINRQSPIKHQGCNHASLIETNSFKVGSNNSMPLQLAGHRRLIYPQSIGNTILVPMLLHRFDQKSTFKTLNRLIQC